MYNYQCIFHSAISPIPRMDKNFYGFWSPIPLGKEITSNLFPYMKGLAATLSERASLVIHFHLIQNSTVSYGPFFGCWLVSIQ